MNGACLLSSMPNAYFVTLELIVYALFAACAWHAWRRGPHVAWQLAAGVIFGVLLELSTVQQIHAYRYGRFLVMVGDVPLAVGMAWACIIYSARLFSDASGLPLVARPVFDGLLALNIDLSMDALAIRLGFWDWGGGLQSGYFGVPFPNFWAWFWVVFSFSFGLRLLTDGRGWAARWLGPLGAIGIGLVGVIGTNALITFVVPRWGYLASVALLLVLAASVVVAQRPSLGVRPVPWPAAVVPLTFHLYFLLAGLISGVIFQPPWLLAVSVAMLLLALYWHRGALPAQGDARK
jgi:hypothetical protein